MKKRFPDEQLISILPEVEAEGAACKRYPIYAISDAAFYTWRKKYDCILAVTAS